MWVCRSTLQLEQQFISLFKNHILFLILDILRQETQTAIMPQPICICFLPYYFQTSLSKVAWSLHAESSAVTVSLLVYYYCIFALLHTPCCEVTPQFSSHTATVISIRWLTAHSFILYQSKNPLIHGAALQMKTESKLILLFWWMQFQQWVRILVQMSLQKCILFSGFSVAVSEWTWRCDCIWMCADVHLHGPMHPNICELSFNQCTLL